AAQGEIGQRRRAARGRGDLAGRRRGVRPPPPRNGRSDAALTAPPRGPSGALGRVGAYAWVTTTTTLGEFLWLDLSSWPAPARRSASCPERWRGSPPLSSVAWPSRR